MKKIVASRWSLVAGVFLLATSNQQPATALAVEVEPMRVEQTVSLSQTTETQLTVSNPLKKAVGVQVSAGQYRAFQPDQRFSSAESWLHFEPARFTLAPGASTAVQVRITPPPAIADDTAGEYLAAIVVDQLPATDSPTGGPAEESSVEGSSQVSIVPRLALPVYLKIEGREKAEVELSGVSLRIAQEMAQIGSGGPTVELLRIDTSLKNTGTVHLRLNGTYALFTEAGVLVRSGPLGKTVPVLPSSTLVLPTLFPLPEPGRYKLALTVESGRDSLLQKEVPFEITGDGRVLQETK